MLFVKYLRHNSTEKKYEMHYLNKSLRHEGGINTFYAFEPQNFTDQTTLKLHSVLHSTQDTFEKKSLSHASMGDLI